MIRQSTLIQTIAQQRANLLASEKGYPRDLMQALPMDLINHALIISGIRRCGKSTLLKQLMNRVGNAFIFLNFDTPVLYNFEIADFALLDLHIREQHPDFLFFDEIQVVEGWELYIREKLDQGYRVVITGSNASLLSRELGTKLTGRHISKELFPFSYTEYCGFTKSTPGLGSLQQYLSEGGFPEYVRTHNPEILSTLLNDILYRDIAVRYQIRNVRSLIQLLTFLATNMGKLISATKLTRVLDLKSTATVLEYLSHFEHASLIQLMPKFSSSYKVQLVNPRKIYFADPALQQAITGSFSDDHGRKLENMVYWELKRRNKALFYYNEDGRECDFLTLNNKKPETLIQVCYNLNSDNEAREVEGLWDAMQHCALNNGVIITLNQKDTILRGGKQIDVIPAYEYFV